MKKIMHKAFIIACVVVCLLSLVIVPCFANEPYANEPYNDNLPVSRSVAGVDEYILYSFDLSSLVDGSNSYTVFIVDGYSILYRLDGDGFIGSGYIESYTFDFNSLTFTDVDGYSDTISTDFSNEYLIAFYPSSVDNAISFDGDFNQFLNILSIYNDVNEFDMSLDSGQASIFINPSIVNDDSSYITVFVHDYSLANDGFTYGVTYLFSGSIYTVSYVNDVGEYVTIQRSLSDGWYHLYFDFEVDIFSPNSNYTASYLSVVSRSYIDDIVSASRQDGYRQGFDDGETSGYNDGVRDGYDDAIKGNYSLVWRNVGLFLRNTLSAFTDAQLFLGVSIGGVLSLVVGVCLFMFIIKLLR